VAEFEEGFGDGAGGGAGEADDADAASARWSGDGYDGVVVEIEGLAHGWLWSAPLPPGLSGVSGFESAVCDFGVLQNRHNKRVAAKFVQ
jgi:hypothetical protein